MNFTKVCTHKKILWSMLVVLDSVSYSKDFIIFAQYWKYLVKLYFEELGRYKICFKVKVYQYITCRLEFLGFVSLYVNLFFSKELTKF